MCLPLPVGNNGVYPDIAYLLIDDVCLNARVKGEDAVGPGEQGQGLVVDPAWLSERQRLRMKEGKQLHSFNEFVSNLISVHRSLPDSREPG